MRYIIALLLASPLLSSCGGSSQAATSGSTTTSSTYQLSSLDADEFKTCTYYGYLTGNTTCFDVDGGSRTSSVSSMSQTTQGQNVFSGFDFIRLAEAKSILAQGNTQTSDLSSDGSYSYIDDAGVTQSGNVNVAIIGTGVGISSASLSTGTSQADTTGYRTTSTSFSKFVADATDAGTQGFAEDLVDGITGLNDSGFAFATSVSEVLASGTTATPFFQTDPTVGGTESGVDAQLISIADYGKNMDPEDASATVNDFTEIFTFDTGNSAYILNTTETQNYGIDDFQDSTSANTSMDQCASNTDCKVAIMNADTNNFLTSDAANDEFIQKHHDVDYFIMEDNDSANGTALAALIDGPNGTSSIDTYSEAMVSGAVINSYKTMFDYGKYFTLFEVNESAATATNDFTVNAFQTFGTYTAETGKLAYADGATINSLDTRTTDGSGDGVIEAYDIRTTDITTPEMFLFEDGNGFQLNAAVDQAIADGAEVLLLNNQFRNYYYDKTETTTDVNATYGRTSDLNIYSYSSLGAFRAATDVSSSPTAIIASVSGPGGSNPEFVVERDFLTVAQVDSGSASFESTNFYDEIIATMKLNSGEFAAAGASKAFVVPADPSLIKMAIMTDSALNTASAADSSTDIDDTKIAATFQNYLFVAGVNADFYTTTTSSDLTETFATGLDVIDEIILKTDTNGTFLSNDSTSTVGASITSTTDTSGNTSLLGDSITTYAADGSNTATNATTNFAQWDCSGLLNCMVVPGNVFANDKYNDFTSYDAMDDSFTYSLDGSESGNALNGTYFTNSDPSSYSSAQDDGVKDTENLASAYVTGAISMILGAYYEEYDEGTLTIDNIVNKMLTYSTPATKIAGCSTYAGTETVSGTAIDCGVGMLNMHRTLAAACTDDTDFDPDGECSVVVNTSGSSENISLSSLTLGSSFGSSLSTSEATNLIASAVYYDNYNFKYAANLESKISANNTNYYLDDYLGASNSKTMYEHLSPSAAFSLDMAYTEYERVYDDGTTTRYFDGPADPDAIQKVSFVNYNLNTSVTKNSSFNFAMENSSTNSLSPSYLSDLTTAVSVTDSNGYFALTGDTINFSEFNFDVNKNISFNFGYITDADASLNNSSNLLYNNLNLSYKKTNFTLSFGSLIEADTMLETQGNASLDFQDDVNTKLYGVAMKHKLSNKFSLIAGYNFGQTDVQANQASIFQDFTGVKSQETTLGLVHRDKGTKIGFLYKEPMRVTSGDVFIQVPTKLHSDGSYSFSNGWISLSPDGREQNFEIFMEKNIDKDTKLKLNLLKRVEPFHIANSKDEDMALISLTKTF